MELTQSRARFQTTSWTDLEVLLDRDEESRRAGLEFLIRRYWPPVYAHLRCRGLSRELAAEETQAFFVDVVLTRRLFERANRRRGRLRSLLLTALQNYRVDCLRSKRTTDLATEDLAREDRKLERTPGVDANCAFERRWALGVFEETLRRCRAHLEGTGRIAHWALFEARVLAPAVTGNEPRPLAESAQPAGFSSAAHAAAAVQVVKRRIEALLSEVVGETIADDDDLTVELAEVRRQLSR